MASIEVLPSVPADITTPLMDGARSSAAVNPYVPTSQPTIIEMPAPESTMFSASFWCSWYIVWAIILATDASILFIGVQGWRQEPHPSTLLTGFLMADVVITCIKFCGYIFFIHAPCRMTGPDTPVDSPWLFQGWVLSQIWIPIVLGWRFYCLATGQVTIANPNLYYYQILCIITNGFMLATWTCLGTCVGLSRLINRIQSRRLLTYFSAVASPVIAEQIWSQHFSSAFEPVCSICIEKYTPKDELVILPCHHNFHRLCMLSTIKSGNIQGCPTCRQSLFPP